MVAVPTLSINGSFVFSPSTACSDDMPTTRFRSSVLIESESDTGGSVPGFPAILPTSESDFVRLGSRPVPIATRPPGVASSSFNVPASNDRTVVTIGSQVTPLPDSTFLPGRISISSPTLRLPSMSEPPMTPPLRLVSFVPGTFTSNDLATYILTGVVFE